MRLLPAAVLASLALAAAGCGSSSTSTTPSSSVSASSSASASVGAATPPSTGGTIQAKIQNFAFTPAVIHAHAGQSVRWVNQDSAAHNVTGTSGPSFTPSPTFGPGGSFTLKLTKPGTYQYVCTIHPFMKASLVVSG